MTSVLWTELRPDDFRQRLADCPVVYLPLGLCEPHGHIAALGLDLIKAEYFCNEAARRFGGIVAPSQGYHIHECGFHAPWLEEVVGNENPFLAAVLPDVMAKMFLYQLRAFANTGFQTIIAVSGHSGGSQNDLRRVAQLFSEKTGVNVVVKTDPEWVEGQYQGDHAGRYEISQLMAIRPDLVDLSLLHRQRKPGSGGRLALGDDAAESSVEHGHAINEAILAAIGELVRKLPIGTPAPRLTFAETELIWERIKVAPWFSNQLNPDQTPVSSNSRWRN